MGNNDKEETGRPALLTQVFGLLTSVVGIIAILSWILGVPVLASFSSDFIPMAPSTAILFISFGITVLLCTRFPKSSWFYKVGIIISTICTLIALLLFFLSSFGIHLAVEHIGFKVEGLIAGTPFGNISPLTAFCFVLAGLSFLISLSPSEYRKLMFAAFSFAFLVILVSIILLLAHLFGTPLLYGTQFIPPALSTSLALFFLGIAIVALIGPKVWRYNSETDAALTRSSVILILVFVVLALGIISSGYFYYIHNEKEFRLEKERELSSVADLKISELTHIRNEWVEGASLFYENTIFSTLVDRHFNNPKDVLAHRPLRTWLSHFKTAHKYNELSLLDAKGVARFTLPDSREPYSYTYKDKISEAIKSGKITIADFYRDEYDQHIYLNILVPILDPKNNKRVNGVLSLRIDPREYFYPYIKSWPTPSRTSETMLVRREGDDVLYLNEVKLKQNTDLSFRIPLKNKHVPAVKAVLGEEGIVEGIDYKNVPVLAYLHQIPNSPWFIVAKIDIAEVYAPLSERLWLMIFLITALLIGSGTSVAVVWRQQRARFYQESFQAAEAMREHADRYRTMVSAALFGFWLVDEKGKLLDVNDTYCSMSGYTREELLNLSTSDLEVIDKPEDIARRIKRIIETGTDQFESKHKAKDGRVFDVDVSASFLYSQKQLIVFIREITDRKLAEETLRESEERFSKIFHTSHTAIAIATLEGPILDVNERLLTMTGFCKEEMIGHSSFELGMISSDARERLVQQLRKEGSIRDMELELRDKYGYTHVVILSMHLIELAGEKRALTMFHDITDRKRIEEKIVIANEELARSNKELEQFAYVASHDLQEPLRMVASYTQLIEKRYKDKLDSDANDFIAFAVDGANRMQVLINDMLMYSRVATRGKTFEPTDMNEVLGQAIVNLRASIEESHTIITNDELPTVSADATQIVQLFQNLISNSIKFRTSNTPFVHVSVIEKPTEWVVSVRDNGIGIAPEYHDRIFVIFRRLHTKEYPGTGIGLAICKRIVELHGGKIWVESEQEKGSTFYFTITKQKGEKRS